MLRFVALIFDFTMVEGQGAVLLQDLTLGILGDPWDTWDKSTTYANLTRFKSGFRAESARAPLTNVGTLLSATL